MIVDLETKRKLFEAIFEMKENNAKERTGARLAIGILGLSSNYSFYSIYRKIRNPMLAEDRLREEAILTKEAINDCLILLNEYENNPESDKRIASGIRMAVETLGLNNGV